MEVKKIKQRTQLLTVTVATFLPALVVTVIRAAVPATQPAALLLPMATSPVHSPRPNLVPVPYRPDMPAAVVSHDPRIMLADGTHPLRARAAIDHPPLATAASPLPAAPTLPVGPAIRVESADVSILPVGTIAEKADTGRSTLRSDPTAGLVQSGALVVIAPPRTSSPPAQFLSIPDPSHQPGAIPAPVATAEDAPAMTLDRPGPTTLPVGGK